MKYTIKRNFASDGYKVTDDKKNLLYKIDIEHRCNDKVWGEQLYLFDAAGNAVGKVQSTLNEAQRKLDVYLGEQCLGSVTYENKMFNLVYTIDYKGWTVQADAVDRKHKVLDADGKQIAVIIRRKIAVAEHFDVEAEPEDLLDLVFFVMAYDASMSETIPETT